MEVKITLVQLEIEDGNKEGNLKKVVNILNDILNDQDDLPDIVCLPELFTTGYDLRNAKQDAEPISGNTLKSIVDISRGKFIVIGGILEELGGNYYNTAFIIGKNGNLIGTYKKTHLFSPMLEKEFLTPGDDISTFTLPSLSDLKIGIAICYDLRFPELFRMMALEGAKVIFVPSEFPSPKRKVWKTLLRARAIENQVFVVGVNRVGQGKSDDFFGCSLVSNGDYVEYLGDKPEVKVFKINLDSLTQIRQKIPLLKDRRADIFKS